MNEPISWTDEQEKIINSKGSALIIACAGSGKSTTIVERAVKELDDLKLWQTIALISFTRKSAEDLNKKLKHKNIKSNARIFATTFHGFLIEHILCFDTLFRGKQFGFNFGTKVNDFNEWQTIIRNQEIIPVAKDPKKDFLFEFANQLLDQQCVKAYLSAKFYAIYIDEAQDNNTLQYDIVDKIMALGIACVLVGDPNQTVYDFRGAAPEEFKNLEQHAAFKEHIFKLTHNHRCHPLINKWANKNLFPEKHDHEKLESGARVGVFVCTQDKEISIIDDSRIKQEGIAILVRKNVDFQHCSFNGVVKVIKVPDLIDKTKFSPYVHGLYRLIFTKNEFNEYNFIDELLLFDRFTQRKIDSNIKNLLTKFVNSPSNETLQKLNELVELIEDNLIENFINSLTMPEAKAYYTYQPNDRLAMTIHSAKGLEFDNVMVFQKDFQLSNPEDKKLHYVAFTRAKKRLFIIKD